MRGPCLEEALEGLTTGGALTLSLGDVPLDELLFSLHTGRFTGAVRLGGPPDPDRIYFREGVVVGLAPPAAHDVQPFGDLLVQMKLMSSETLAAVWELGPKDGVALSRCLLDEGLLGPDAVARATEEHARRRLFSLYELGEDTPIELRAGLESLAHFNPIYLDVRPVIAFGMVVRADADRIAPMADKVRGRGVRLMVPYDARRNSYGLPPPVLLALQDLAQGVKMRDQVVLPGLSAHQTAGVLMLFDRMSLLSVD